MKNRLIFPDPTKRVYEVGEPIPKPKLIDKFPDMTFNAPLNGSLALAKGNGPATFTRNSPQLAINDSGNWQKFGAHVPAFGPQGLLIEPSALNRCACHSVPRPDALGPDVVINGSFTSNTGWTLGNGAMISNGICNLYNSSDTFVYPTVDIMTPGERYQATFTYSLRSGSFYCGSNTATVPNPEGNTSFSRPGTKTVTIEFIALTSRFVFRKYGGGTLDVDLDNVSVREITDGLGAKNFHDGTAWQNAALPNVYVNGDVSTNVKIVDDSDALKAAGLYGLTNAGKAYRFNQATSALSMFNIASSAAAGPYSISIFVRNTGNITFGLSNTGGDKTVNIPPSTKYRRIFLENIIPVTQGNRLQFTSYVAGQEAHFIIPQLEELPMCTSPVMTSGVQGSRAETFLTWPSAGNINATDLTITFQATIYNTPPTSGVYDTSLNSYLDAQNNWYFFLRNDNIGWSNLKAGAARTARRYFAVANDATLKIAYRVSSVTGATHADSGIIGTSAATGTDLIHGPTLTLWVNSRIAPHFIKALCIYSRAFSDQELIDSTK